jgi:hypothetical protein
VTRAAVAVLGVLLLAVAAWFGPDRSEETAGTAAALGRSMGGARVVLVDALFLRAEALRRRGRLEDLPTLYGTVLDLDPGNEAAFDHLASVYAFDLPVEAARPEDRAAWWREGWDAVEKGLEIHPRSLRLLLRSAELLRRADEDAALADAVPAGLGDPAVAALERIRTAAEISDEVPGLGRYHLLLGATMAPEVAARRLVAAPRESERALAVGDALLALRREALADALLPSTVLSDEPGREVDLATLLDVGLRTVREVARARAAGDREAARVAAQALANRFPGWPTTETLLRAAEAP